MNRNNDPKHFYLKLLSTALQHIYPDNTHYDFIVELAQTIDLSNNYKWEVGLSGYACPPTKTWYPSGLCVCRAFQGFNLL